MVVVAMRYQHDIDCRQRLERDAGIVVPPRPAQANGETRTDQTGSTRMFKPAVWISQLAWPTNESRTVPPSTRAGGLSENGLGSQSGHFARFLSRSNCQRSKSRKAFGGAPSGSKKRSPSKWSDLGPE